MEELNIQELLRYYLANIVIIVVVTLLFALGGLFYFNEIKTPLYKSSTTLVLTRLYETNSGKSEITQSDILLNKQLVASYREIIISKRILSRTIEELDLKYSITEIRDMIDVSSVKDTELISISVSNVDNKNAKNIANKVAEIFSEEIADIYNIKNIKIVDKADVSSKPYNISVAKQTIITAIVGFILICAIIFTRYYFDDSIKTVAEVEKKLQLPILGTVPTKKKGKGDVY